MITINYRYGELPHCKITKFPDGQQLVTLDMDYFNNPKELVEIKCSIENWRELEVLMCLVAALKQADYLIFRIEYMYMFGLRSDRVFAPGTCNYVRDVLAPILNHLEAQCMNCSAHYMPHGRSKLYFPKSDARAMFFEPFGYHQQYRDYIKIAADKSAVSKVLSSFPQINLNDGDIGDPNLYFNKTRTENGIVVSLDQKHLDYLQAKRGLSILIVDDMCDGGATFLAEAKYLSDNNLIGEGQSLELFVTHGIFSQGFDQLFKVFDKIYTTNSLDQQHHIIDPDEVDNFHVFDIWK